MNDKEIEALAWAYSNPIASEIEDDIECGAMRHKLICAFKSGFTHCQSIMQQRLDERDKEIEKLKAGIKRMGEHCLCERNQNGFDYGETHERLGKAKVGARWLTPNAIAKMILE